MTHYNSLDSVSNQRDTLIRAEIRAQAQRALFERAVVEAVLKLGNTVDDVSAVSGLPVDQIRKLISDYKHEASLDELAALAGMR